MVVEALYLRYYQLEIPTISSCWPCVLTASKLTVYRAGREGERESERDEDA